MHDRILKLQQPKGMTVIGSTEDIGMTIVAPDIKKIEILTSEVIFEINSWLDAVGLAFAKRKTKVILITKRKK